LSGNRNFEGRVNADVRANYLASPPLVVAYALAGSMYSDLVKQPLGLDKKGKKVFLRDIWPSSREINGVIRKTLNKQMFTKKYADVFKGDSHWRSISVKGQAARFQPVRHSPRESRGDDARHFRQHPSQEPDGAGRRGRRDRPLSLTPAHADLRRRHALQERQGSARRFRRQGIRQRIL